MSSQHIVYENKATYYKTSDKKWISGVFKLNSSNLHFAIDENKQDPSFRIPLNSISGIEKRQSSFIYAAIVISVGAEKHWFASFTNRDTVFNLIELFWRESLLSVPTRRVPSAAKEASSSLGKDLLSILHESEVSLIDAANALSSQGRQLEESQMLMQDINEDLNAADKFLRSMSLTSTLIGIKESGSDVEEEKSIDNEPEKPRHKSFKVTFSEKSSCVDHHEKGTLEITDKIFVLDEHQIKQVQIFNDEVERILVTSPWAFSLEYSSEWVTKTCYFVCPQLSGLLKTMNCVPAFKKKITYENENSSKNTLNTSSDTISGETSKCSSFASLQPLKNSKSNSLIHIQETSDVLSDEDMEQISNVLNNLKDLAIEVSREQKDQMEKINSLIADVDKTDLRINESNKDIKKKT